MSQYPLDRPIKGRLPFLKDQYILFINNSAGAEAEAIIRQHYPYLKDVFESEGFRFIYLPEFLASLPIELLDYFFPGDNIRAIDDIQAAIQRYLNLDVVAGFIRCERGKLFLDEFGGTLFDESFYDAIFEYAERIRQTADYYENNRIRPRIINKKESFEITSPAEELFDESGIRFSVCKEEKIKTAEELDPEVTDAVHADLQEIIKKYKDFGVGISDLIDILNREWKPLPLRITRNKRIFVTGRNEVEVRMPQLQKALFFLFLKYPEGIRFKELRDYRDELLSIYLDISRQDDPEANERRIDSIFSRDNRINEIISTLNKAFTEVLQPQVARFYCIEGPAGEAKKILLDRSLVTWEK